MNVAFGYEMLGVFFLAGAGLVALTLIYMIGPAARKWALAHMFHKLLLEIPRFDRTVDFERKKPDKRGKLVLPKYGQYAIMPEKVYAGGMLGNARLAYLPEGLGQNVSGEDAQLASEATGKGAKGGDVSIKVKERGGKGEIVLTNYRFSDLIKMLKGAPGADQVADFVLDTWGATQPPVEKKGISKGLVIKMSVVVIVFLVIFVGIYLARAKGMI